MGVEDRNYLGEWLRLWNGRIDLIDSVIHPEFVAHVPGLESFGREQLRQAIISLRNHFDVYSVRADIGPVSQGDLVAGRWIAVAVSAGESSYWVGQSIFGIRDGLIAEHWEIVAQLQGAPFDLEGIAEKA